MGQRRRSGRGRRASPEVSASSAGRGPILAASMGILVCGSLAFDTIMVFPDQFRRHILPDQIHILNVAFLVPQMRREYGGTAGNIGYNLKLLGEDPLIMATV